MVCKCASCGITKTKFVKNKGNWLSPHKLSLLRAKLIFYLYHDLKRHSVCASRRIKYVSTASTTRLQNAKSKWSFSFSQRRNRPLSDCRKKYKRAKKAANWSAAGCDMFSTLRSSASLASALSIVGLPAAVPLGGVGGAFAAASSGLIIASKKLDSKIKNTRRLWPSPSENETRLIVCFPKLWPTIKYQTVNFSYWWLNFRSTMCSRMLFVQNSLVSRLDQMLRR